MTSFLHEGHVLMMGPSEYTLKVAYFAYIGIHTETPSLVPPFCGMELSCAHCQTIQTSAAPLSRCSGCKAAHYCNRFVILLHDRMATATSFQHHVLTTGPCTPYRMTRRHLIGRAKRLTIGGTKASAGGSKLRLVPQKTRWRLRRQP